jgi:hypothetical protein
LVHFSGFSITYQQKPGNPVHLSTVLCNNEASRPSKNRKFCPKLFNDDATAKFSIFKVQSSKHFEKWILHDFKNLFATSFYPEHALLKVCLQENGRATEFWSYDSNRKAPNLVV